MSSLEKVDLKNLLDVKEKMTLIPETLQKFLDIKHKKSLPKEQFSINELFESILPKIKELYKLKLDNRDSHDEFGVDNFEIGNIVDGINSKDLIYYRKTFVPAALYYIYKEIHPNYEAEEELMNDLFSIGAGSKTENLTPEIVTVCQMCIEKISQEQFGTEDVDNLNQSVFKHQLRDNFQIDGYLGSSDSSVSLGDRSMKEDITREDSVFNPFSQDCEDSITGSSVYKENAKPSLIDKETDLYVCPVCSKQFTRSDFVEYHRKLFHKQKSDSQNDSLTVLDSAKTVTAQFVDDDDLDLMKTFDVDNDPSYESGGQIDAEKARTTNSEVVAKTVTTQFVDDEALDLMKTFDVDVDHSTESDDQIDEEKAPSTESDIQTSNKKQSLKTRTRGARKVLKYPN